MNKNINVLDYIKAKENSDPDFAKGVELEFNKLEFKRVIEKIRKFEKISDRTVNTTKKILQKLELSEDYKFPRMSSEQDDKGTIELNWYGQYGKQLYFFINEEKIEYLRVCPEANLKMDDGEVILSEISELWNWFIKHERTLR